MMTAILIITNNNDIRELFQYILSDRHLIIEAETSNEGIELFEKHRPDIIITDLHMSVIHGRDFVTYVRSTKLPVKILAFSTEFSQPTERDKMLQAGANLCLKIPVDPDLLSQTVQGLSL